MDRPSSMRYMANTTGAVPRQRPVYTKDACRLCGKYLSRRMMEQGHRCGKQTRSKRDG